MKYFKLTLKFDYGTFRIITSASSQQAAIIKVCKAENCPESAVVHICEHSGAGYSIKY